MIVRVARACLALATRALAPRFVVLLSLTLGCATVAPWERELLAHPAMADAPDPTGAGFDAHLDAAREAALDPGASGGGGCGCN